MASKTPEKGSDEEKGKKKDEKKKSKQGTDWFEVAVGGGTMILQGVEQAAAFAPVPFLQTAAGSALKIIEMVQDVKSNKDAFKQLAEDSGSIVYAIWRSFQQSGDQKNWPGKQLDQEVADILGALKDIQDFVAERIDRNWGLRFITGSGDKDKIEEYRTRLQHAVNRFMVAADLGAHEHLRQIIQDLQELKETIKKQQEAATSAAEKAKVKEEEERKAHAEQDERQRKLEEERLNQEALERMKAKEREFFATKHEGSRSRPSSGTKNQSATAKEGSPAPSHRARVNSAEGPVKTKTEGKQKQRARRLPSADDEDEGSAKDEQEDNEAHQRRSRKAKPKKRAVLGGDLSSDEDDWEDEVPAKEAHAHAHSPSRSRHPHPPRSPSPSPAPPGHQPAADPYDPRIQPQPPQPPYPNPYHAPYPAAPYPPGAPPYGSYPAPGGTMVYNYNSGNYTNSSVTDAYNDNSVRISYGTGPGRRSRRD